MVRRTKGLVDLKRTRKVQSNSTMLTHFRLWAYDTVQLLASAIERAGIVNSTFHKPNITDKIRVDLANAGMYDTGQRLHSTILATKFRGISGDFKLIDGHLKPSVLGSIQRDREQGEGYWILESPNRTFPRFRQIW